MEITSFNEIADDFIELAHSVVYCSAATIDRRGRPRSRMLHTIWELVDGRPVGWIATVPSSHKAKHLAHHAPLSARPHQLRRLGFDCGTVHR